jgi:hypothetical protein
MGKQGVYKGVKWLNSLASERGKNTFKSPGVERAAAAEDVSLRLKEG